MSGPLLVFGAGGQLGREILELAASVGRDVVGLARAQVDITDEAAVARVISEIGPRLVVNAGAYTAVDRAESDPQGAQAGNVVGPRVLARAAAKAGVPIVHFSTDYVFDGSKRGPYKESDPIAPLGVYGRSKAEGEVEVRVATSHHVIVRTAWVYGVYGANFLKTMLRLSRERDELRVVADQQGCPTATMDLAKAVFAIDDRLSAGYEAWGTYHFAGTGETSWHGFAAEILDAAAPLTGRRPAVTAIATADYPTPARRPANSVLDSSRFAEVFGYRAAPWRERTREAVRQLVNGVQ